MQAISATLIHDPSTSMTRCHVPAIFQVPDSTLGVMFLKCVLHDTSSVLRLHGGQCYTKGRYVRPHFEPLGADARLVGDDDEELTHLGGCGRHGAELEGACEQAGGHSLDREGFGGIFVAWDDGSYLVICMLATGGAPCCRGVERR